MHVTCLLYMPITPAICAVHATLILTYTAQITLFADREPRVKPLLIFKEKGKRISFREKVSRALSMLVLIIVLYVTLSFSMIVE